MRFLISVVVLGITEFIIIHSPREIISTVLQIPIVLMLK